MNYLIQKPLHCTYGIYIYTANKILWIPIPFIGNHDFNAVSINLPLFEESGKYERREKKKKVTDVCQSGIHGCLFVKYFTLSQVTYNTEVYLFLVCFSFSHKTFSIF